MKFFKIQTGLLQWWKYGKVYGNMANMEIWQYMVRGQVGVNLTFEVCTLQYALVSTTGLVESWPSRGKAPASCRPCKYWYINYILQSTCPAANCSEHDEHSDSHLPHNF